MNRVGERERERKGEKGREREGEKGREEEKERERLRGEGIRTTQKSEHFLGKTCVVKYCK